MLSSEQYLNSCIFNYDFAHSRCDMYNTFKNFITEYDNKQMKEEDVSNNDGRSTTIADLENQMNEFQLSLMGREPAGVSKVE